MAELGQTADPTQLVPGDPDGLRAVAAEWNERARLADEAGAALHALPVPEDWSGASANSFEARVTRVGARWSLVADAATVAASALESFASTLAWAQRQAEIAAAKWAEGQRVSADALAAPISVAPIDPVNPVDPGSPLRRIAQELLEDARERVRAAGDSAAASIRAAGDEQDLDPDVWEALGVVTATPEEALALLGTMSDEEDLNELLALRPELAGLVAAASAPAVSSWWKAMVERGSSDDLVRAMPRVIGNLEGVAYGDRDEANRIQLVDQLQDAEAELASAKATTQPSSEDLGATALYHARIDTAEARLAALENVEQALAAGDNRYLVSLTNDSPPLAAVAIGDLDTADNVTVAVPGMGATSGGMVEWAASADRLQQQQELLDSNRDHAVVAWIGYETPPVPGEGGFNVFGTELAEAGAAKLGVALGGLDSVRGTADLNVVAHSYGTTTASIALAQPGVSVDTFVSVGSAGLPADIDHASDLHAGEVYAGQARDVMAIDPQDGDQWAWVGRDFGNHPVNPVSESFGAHAFGADGGPTGRAVLDHATSTPEGAGYLDAGTESMRNVALATTGSGDRVSEYVAPDPTALQQGLSGGHRYGY